MADDRCCFCGEPISDDEVPLILFKHLVDGQVWQSRIHGHPCGDRLVAYGLFTPAETLAALVEELQRKDDQPMELVLRPASVFQLTALVQLACRHPGVTGPMRETSDRLLAGVRAHFADCPTVLEVVRRGDDPTEDR